MHSDTLVSYRGKSENIVALLTKASASVRIPVIKTMKRQPHIFSKAEREEVIV